MLPPMETPADFRRQIFWAVALPPALFLILWAIYFGLVVGLLSELNRVVPADRLLDRANATSRLLVDREAALLGYLAEGSPDLLSSYRRATARLGDHLDELDRLASGDPARSSQLGRIREQGDLWGHLAGELIGLRAGPSWRDRPAEGEARLYKLRVSLSEILEAEEIERDRRREATQTRYWTILAACSGVAIALGVILAYSSRRRMVTLCGTFEAALADLQANSDRQERETLRLMSEAMKYYAIFNLDTEGRISTWNGDAERILGYRADDVLARRPSYFYSQDDVKRDVLHRDLEWAAVEGRVEDDRWLTRKDGFRFKARIALGAIRDFEGGLCGYTNVIHEIEDHQG